MLRSFVLVLLLVLVPITALASGCHAVLDIDDVEFGDGAVGGSGGGGLAGGTGGGGGSCPNGEQDNDGDGTCEPACSADTCSGHGTCDDSSGTTSCTCDVPFDGPACTNCVEGHEGSDCTSCAVGYQDGDGDGTCAPACDGATCSGDGTCDDSSGAASCTCRPDFMGDDCGTACPGGMAGSSCDFRIIYGLDIPAAVVDWDEVADVPYDIDDGANAGSFDRVGYRLILDDEEVWVELDPFTVDATELGLPMDVVHEVAVENVTVASFAANQASITVPSDGNVEMWSNCYSVGLNGVYDYDDDVDSSDCYGSFQVHVGAETILAFNRWSSTSNDHDVGIGTSPTGNPDYTFETNADDYAARRLEVYLREP